MRRAPPQVQMTLTIPLLNNATSLDVTAQDITRAAIGALVFGKSTLSPLESARIVLNVSSTQNVAARRLSQVAFAVDVTVSAVSNSQVIQFKSVLEASVVSAVQSALASAGIPVGDVSTQQVVIVPSPSLASGGQFASCETHYDCNGMFCSAKKECMDCRFCLVSTPLPASAFESLVSALTSAKAPCKTTAFTIPRAFFFSALPVVPRHP